MRTSSTQTWPMHELALRAISVDFDLQSRERISTEYQREFSEAMRRGAVFPPVIVFFDGMFYWLADGFHRFAAAGKAFRDSIMAEVRSGTRRDAIVFSAGANQKFSIPRTPADIKKAIWLLLADPEWFTKNDSSISRHVGCTFPTVRKYRVEYCAVHRLALPSTLTRDDGLSFTCNYSGSGELQLRHHRAGGKQRYATSVNGRRIMLGSDQAVAAAKLEALRSNVQTSRSNITAAAVTVFLSARGIPASVCPSLLRSVKEDGHMSGNAFWIAATDNHGKSVKANFAEFVGRVILGRQFADPSARAVLICYREDISTELADLAEVIGVDLLTPQQLADSILNRKDGP